MSSAVRIAPSILSADLGRLADEVREVEQGGADWIHVDVMDGRFVPNITLGPAIVKAVRRATTLPVDVHLMIVEPERYVEQFAEAGADVISVHIEASTHLQRTLAEIRRLGKRAGVVLNPHTPEEHLRYVLGDVDLILVMSVNPGFGGQAFLPQVLPEARGLRRMIDEAGVDVDLEVDGGVGPETARQVFEAGARVLVAGSAVFGKKDRPAAIAAIRKAAAGGARPAAEVARPAAGGVRSAPHEAPDVCRAFAAARRRGLPLGRSPGARRTHTASPDPRRCLRPARPAGAAAAPHPKDSVADQVVARALAEVSRLRELPAKGPVRGRLVSRAVMVEHVRQDMHTEVPPDAHGGSGGGVVRARHRAAGLRLRGEPDAADDRAARGVLRAEGQDHVPVGGSRAERSARSRSITSSSTRCRISTTASASCSTTATTLPTSRARVHALAEGGATSAMLDAMLAPRGRRATDLSDDAVGCRSARLDRAVSRRRERAGYPETLHCLAPTSTASTS